MADTNSLGLDFEKEEQDAKPETKPEKKKPYANPERVKTGGAQREKPSEEELATMMQRIKVQNEKIKQRREDVKADEEAFRKTQEAERVKQAQTRKVQEGVDRTREQNARRKMDKMDSREWDSGKHSAEPDRGGKPARGGGGRSYSGPRGRGRGRGRGAARAGPDTAPTGEAESKND